MDGALPVLEIGAAAARAPTVLPVVGGEAPDGGEEGLPGTIVQISLGDVVF